MERRRYQLSKETTTNKVTFGHFCDNVSIFRFSFYSWYMTLGSKQMSFIKLPSLQYHRWEREIFLGKKQARKFPLENYNIIYLSNLSLDSLILVLR